MYRPDATETMHMIASLLRRLKWLGALAVLVPFLAAGFEYMSTEEANAFAMRGVETVAVIEGGKHRKGRRSGDSYSLDLAWKDGNGQIQRATGVHINRSLADQIIVADTLTRETLRIRYIPDEPERKPLILDNGPGHPSGDPIRNAAAVFSTFAPVAVFGGLLFWWLRRRELRTAAQPG
jgi:hypothetical protein